MSNLLFFTYLIFHLQCYVLPQINGKHLDKIIAASVEKVTKKSIDKLKLHVTRTIQARPRMCDAKVGAWAGTVFRSPLEGTVWRRRTVLNYHLCELFGRFRQVSYKSW